jgi:SlyX protein
MDNLLIDLQTRLSFQEDEIKHLNRSVVEQQTQIERLSDKLERLQQLIGQLAPSQVGDIHDEPPPPHY